MLLRGSGQHEIQYSYVLAARWYAAAENMQFIVLGLQKHFGLPLQENRHLALRATEQQQGRVGAVDTLSLPVGQTRQLWLAGVPWPLLLTKAGFTNKDGSTGLRYLVTDDLTRTYDQIVKLYQRRWSIAV